jgi:hypothetical protein
MHAAKSQGVVIGNRVSRYSHRPLLHHRVNWLGMRQAKREASNVRAPGQFHVSRFTFRDLSSARDHLGVIE